MKAKNFYFLLIIFSISFLKISSLEENNFSNEYITSLEELKNHLHSSYFKNHKKVKEQDEPELKELFAGDECLMSKNEAVKVLKESYGIDNPDPDDNLKFIIGKCSPVLLIPGIYATKLVVELQCKNIANEEKNYYIKRFATILR